MTFTDQKFVLVQGYGATLGELRLLYGEWQFIPLKDVELTGEHMLRISQRIQELNDNER